MFKRCIAVLLMAAMLMGVVPTAVHAAPVYYNEEIHTDFGELLYNLDDDAFWLMVYGYVQLDDKSAWYFAFLFQHPDFYSLLQAYKGFMFVMHNPVMWADPLGLFAAWPNRRTPLPSERPRIQNPLPENPVKGPMPMPLQPLENPFSPLLHELPLYGFPGGSTRNSPLQSNRRFEGSHGFYADPLFYSLRGPNLNLGFPEFEMLVGEAHAGFFRFGREFTASWHPLSNANMDFFSGDAALGLRLAPGANDNFAGVNLGVYMFRGHLDFAVPIPFTSRNLNFGLEGSLGSIGGRFTAQDGRIRAGLDIGKGAGISVGINRR